MPVIKVNKLLSRRKPIKYYSHHWPKPLTGNNVFLLHVIYETKMPSVFIASISAIFNFGLTILKPIH